TRRALRARPGSGAGRAVSPDGRHAGDTALGASGSAPAPYSGSRVVGHASCIPGPRPAGNRTADRPGASLDGCQGLGSAGGGAGLWPGAGVVHAARRDVAALSDPVGLMALLSEPRGTPDRA